jgi:SAM-dependent methyltransferase
LSAPLEFTGERFTPECVREIRYEHVHRYAFAQSLVRGKQVLDGACGEGYGSALLAATAAAVTGVDLSEEAVRHASERYNRENLVFRQADCLALPFEDDAFDCVVSFETLEHLAEHDRLLAEFRRVLRPDGCLLISTPDKAVYTDQLGNRNEFHVAELYRDEFGALLGRHFGAVRQWGQRLTFQSTIWSLDGEGPNAFHRERDTGVETGDRPPHEAVYLLALCAADASALSRALPGLSLFDDEEESVYAHYYHEIRKNMATGVMLQEKDREIESLRAALAGKSRPAAPWWRRLLGRG